MDPVELAPGKAFAPDVFADAQTKAALFAGKSLEVRVVVMMSSGRVCYDGMPYVLEQMKAAVADERQRWLALAEKLATEYQRRGYKEHAALAQELAQKIFAAKA